MDRFRRAQWQMLLAVMGCYLFYYTGRQNFGFINQALRDELKLSAADVGVIGGGMLLAYGLGQAVNGGLADRFGARRMMTIGALASAVLNWAASFAGGYYMLLVCWTANGYAQSFGWAPGSKLISEWWGRHERGRAFGFYTLAAGFSSVLTFALCLAVLHFLDWRWVLRLPVLLLLVAGVVFYRVARDRPQELGFLPLPEERGESEHAEPPPAADETAVERYLSVLTNVRFLVACAALGLESVARYGLLFWVPAHYLGEHWKEQPGAAWITLALPIGMALGAVTSGQISDRLFGGNRSRPIGLWLLLAAGVVLALGAVPRDQTALGIVLLFLAGFLVYGPQACFWALCPDLLGRGRAGTGVGVMDAFAYGFAALGEVIIGRAIDDFGSTSVMFPIVAGCCALAAAIIQFVRR
jgi:OPA family glycerol-3-phosphate transporter-like MFS transporter